MSTAESTAITDEQVNADVIAGLREVADFLEAHPELPHMRATIGAYPWGDESRPTLTALARALGEKATEKVDRYRVYIEGQFGSERVRVSADVPITALGGSIPPAPKYEPIIRDGGVR